GFLALAAVQTGVVSNLGRQAFAGPDPIIDIWTLHWVATHLLKDPARLFEGNIFFPARDTVLVSDPLVGPAVLVQPLLLFTSNPLLLYNAAVLLALALTSHGLWRLTRALGADGGSAPGAADAGGGLGRGVRAGAGRRRALLRPAAPSPDAPEPRRDLRPAVALAGLDPAPRAARMARRHGPPPPLR